MMARVIFDGAGAVLGRLGTIVAKELLKGNEVIVINSESVIVSGKKDLIVDNIKRKQRMGRGGSMKGPKYPKSVDRLLKRMIRGMLPWDRAKGREAYKRLKCFVSDGGLKEDELKTIKKLNWKKPYRYSTMREIVGALKS